MKLLIKKIGSIILVSLIMFSLMIIFELATKLFLPSLGVGFFVQNHFYGTLFSCIVNYLFGFYVFNNIKILRNLSVGFIIITYFILFTSLVFVGQGFEKAIHNVLILPFLFSLFLGVHLRRNYNTRLLILSKVSLVLTLLLTLFYFYPINNQYVNFNNFDGKLNKSLNKSFFFTNDNDTIHFNGSNIDKNIYVIDFWNNTCGVCIKKFPDLKKLRDKYKKYDNIKFITVNVIKNEKDKLRANELLKKTFNEDLDNYFIHENEVKEFEIAGFPKLVVVKNNNIVFDGFIETLSIFDYKYFK